MLGGVGGFLNDEVLDFLVRQGQGKSSRASNNFIRREEKEKKTERFWKKGEGNIRKLGLVRGEKNV